MPARAAINLPNYPYPPVVEAMGRYEAAVRTGNVWNLSTALAGVTMASGMKSPVAGASTVFIAIYNPLGSGVNLVLLQAVVWTVSGTPAGPFAYNVKAASGCSAAGGDAAVNALTFVQGGSTAKTFTNAAMTGAAASLMLRGIGGPSAIATGVGVNSVMEDLAGDIILQPDSHLIIAPTDAGTSHVAGASLTWLEAAP